METTATALPAVRIQRKPVAVGEEPTERTLPPLAPAVEEDDEEEEEVATASLPAVAPPSSPLPLPEQALRVAPHLPKRSLAAARLLQEHCRQFNLATFFQENSTARSLGFTSAISGEGKSFLAVITANLLANDSSEPVTLVECNWEHPSLHEYYGIAARPGLAEWVRGECQAGDVRYRVESNLTVVPAGNGRKDAVRLLESIRQQGLLKLFEPHRSLFVVDLPAITTTAYGPIAAGLLDTVVMVVRAGVTPDSLVAEACTRLKDVPVQGIILNQLQSKIPRWLRQIL